MNILHISPYLPSVNENHAGGICMGKQVETLRERHKVHVLSFIVTGKDEELAAQLDQKQYTLHRINKIKKICWVLSHFWMPNLFAARSSRAFAKDLIRLVKELEIDVIHAEYAAMGQYIWIKRLYPHIQFNLVEHDVTVQSYERKVEKETSILKKIYLKLQLSLIHCYEKKYCTEADRVFVFNEKDKRLVQKLYRKKEVELINPYYGIEHTQCIRLNQANHICFVGQMGRVENTEAAIRLIRICNHVKNRIPDLKVYIIGNAPPASLCALANDFVRVTGYVDNIEDIISSCRLAVFPLEAGAGIKLKVLISLALGLPVVTTMIGAEGIDEAGEVVRIAETDEMFEQIIIELLENPTLCEALSLSGLHFVERHFSWEKTEEVFKKVYSAP